MPKSLIPLVAPVVFLVYTLSFLTRELHLLIYGLRTRGWCTAEGTVLHSEIRAGWMPINLAGGWSRLYQPSVIYRYTVAGKELHGSQLGYSGGWSPLRWSADYWKAGDHVQISYDPANPSRAVLQRGVSFDNGIGVALGLLYFGVALVWTARSLAAP
jgi:hypothetical protein